METNAKQPLQEEKRKLTMDFWKQGDEIYTKANN
jgi:hypothetical protein